MMSDMYAEITRHRNDLYTLGKSMASSIYGQRLFAARRAAQEAFALERGWRLGKAFTVEQLRDGRAHWRPEDKCWFDGHHCKHTAHFWNERTPVAITASVYCDLADCQAFAEKHGLQVEQLAESWYWPGHCLAVVYAARRHEPTIDIGAGITQDVLAATWSALAAADYYHQPYRNKFRLVWWPADNLYPQARRRPDVAASLRGCATFARAGRIVHSPPPELVRVTANLSTVRALPLAPETKAISIAEDILLRENPYRRPDYVKIKERALAFAVLEE